MSNTTRAPLLALAGAATLIALGYHVALLRHVYNNADFSGDDIITLAQIDSMSAPHFLLTPINEHFVPLHRLVAYAANAIAPMNYGLALFIMTMFHVVGVAYLFGTLRLLEQRFSPGTHERPTDAEFSSEGGWLCRSQWSWFLIGLYAAQVYLGPLYGWWTAGLHRLPFIAFALMATYYYLRHRERGMARDFLIAAICMLASLGFFVKAVLVPLYLLGLEICLWVATKTRPRRKDLLFLGSCLATGLFFLLMWRAAQPSNITELNLDLKVQRDFFAANGLIIRDGAIGSIFTGGLFGLSKQAIWEPVVATVLWASVFIYTVARKPSNIVVWLLLLLALVPNVLLISLSKFRTGGFGALSALINQRYYFELYFPVVLFLAVAGYRVRRSTASRRWAWLTASAASLMLLAVAINAYVSSRHLVSNAKAKLFLDHLKADAARIAQSTGYPIPIVDGGVPSYIVAWPPEFAKASVVLPAMGVKVTLALTEANAYKLLQTGELVAAKPPLPGLSRSVRAARASPAGLGR